MTKTTLVLFLGFSLPPSTFNKHSHDHPISKRLHTNIMTFFNNTQTTLFGFSYIILTLNVTISSNRISYRGLFLEIDKLTDATKILISISSILFNYLDCENIVLILIIIYSYFNLISPASLQYRPLSKIVCSVNKDFPR